MGLIATLRPDASHPASNIATLVACATLFPLLPVHSGFCRHCGGFAGQSPAFLAMLLPMVGFHDLQVIPPTLSGTVLRTLGILAPHECPYGSLRALIQSRPLPRLAYAALAFFGMLWCRYVADTGTAPIPATIYLPPAACCWPGCDPSPVQTPIFEHSAAWPIPPAHARHAVRTARACSSHAAVRRIFRLLSMLLLGRPLRRPASFAIIMLVWLTASWYQD